MKMSTGKVCSLRDAVSEIPDETVVAVGGMTNYRRPITLVLEMIAQAKRDLTLLAMTAGLETDLLIGAGCVRTLRSSYTGLEVFGMAPMFRKMAEAGRLSVVEETEMSVAAGLRAALSGVEFLPSRALAGTDLLKIRPDIRTVVCPYSGERLAALPALRPKVALVHALVCDEQGNACLGGNLNVDIEMATVAELTIVSTEAVVSHDEVVSRGVDLIGLTVDHVVAAPGGAWPTSCHPFYSLDGDVLLDYMEACDGGAFQPFVDRLRRGRGAA